MTIHSQCCVLLVLCLASHAVLEAWVFGSITLTELLLRLYGLVAFRTVKLGVLFLNLSVSLHMCLMNV